MSKLLTIEQTSRILNVSQNTLREWDKKGINILPVKTVGGHRRYREDDVNKFVGETGVEEKITNIVVTYSRVSSHEQKTKGDLDRQSQRLSEYCAKKKYVVHHIIKDVGSGLSDTRTGFVKMVDLVIKKKINKVIIENKDRLTRFQFNLIKTFFNSYDVEIECMENTNISNEEEFVNDIMMLMASFSGKLYGKRSVKRKKELKEQKESIKTASAITYDGITFVRKDIVGNWMTNFSEQQISKSKETKKGCDECDNYEKLPSSQKHPSGFHHCKIGNDEMFNDWRDDVFKHNITTIGVKCFTNNKK